MKRTLLVLAKAAVMAAVLQFVPAGGVALAATPVTKMTAEPSALVVETLSMEAKVTAIDSEKRTVTLTRDGESKTVTCGPEVENFDQIKVGDQVRLTMVESLALSIQKAGAPAGGEEVDTVALAPKGAKPGVLVTKTVVLKAKIDTIDLKARTVTVTEANGALRTIKVAQTVNGLEQLQKGDDVVLRFTEALALVVEAPAKS